MRKVTAASIALALMTSISAIAQTVKHDTKIAKAGAAKAAEKIGDIRGTIDYNETPKIITKEDLQKENKVSAVTNYSTDSTSTFLSVDTTITGSIKTKKSPIKRRVIWDKFDRYGNLIE